MKGCEQSVPDGGRGNDELCEEVSPAILHVLCSATSWVSVITSGFPGIKGSRCLCFVALKRKRQVLCAGNSRTDMSGLKVAPPGIPRFESFALVELLVHVRVFDNFQCVTVAPTASGFSQTFFSFSYLMKK